MHQLLVLHLESFTETHSLINYKYIMPVLGGAACCHTIFFFYFAHLDPDLADQNQYGSMRIPIQNTGSVGM
jgi:hypothetical protein